MPKVDVKVVLLGASDVGKTSLVERYLHNKFQPNQQMTVGAAFGAKTVQVKGKNVTLGIWDTAGAERYESMSRIYYKSARGAVVCYDVTNERSFEKVKFWVSELRSNEEDLDLVSDPSVEREILYKEIAKYGKQIGATVVETSSKSGMNVRELFSMIAQDFVDTYRADSTIKEYSPALRISQDDEPKGGLIPCCNQ